MKKFLTKSAKAMLFLFVMLVFVQANAQKRYAPLAVTDFQYTIENDVLVSSTELQFDLYLKDTDGSDQFDVNNVQAGVIIPSSFYGTGTLTASIITGYSDMIAAQQPTSLGASSTGSYGFCIKLTPKSPVAPGTILATSGLGTRLVRLKVTSTLPFAGWPCTTPGIAFNFTTSPYPTKMFANISGSSTPITCNAANCHTGTSYLASPNTPVVYNVTGGGSYCMGTSSTIPVGVANSQTGVSYWLYAGGVLTTQSVAGNGGAVSFGNQTGTLAGTSYTVKAVHSSGCSVFMNGTVVVAQVSCTPTWSGAVSTGWDNPNNWLGLSVPLTTDDVIIPLGCPRYPVLTVGTTHYCHNMELDGTGAKSILSGGLTISGVMIISGNLTITATGVLDCAPGGALTVDGNLIINGSMTVETQGSLITNGTVTGTATIQRSVAGNMAWHLLSSPIGYQAICNGVFAPSAVNFPGDITTWDFYKWLANCLPAVHWRNLRNADLTMNTVDFGTPPAFEVTKGYLAAYGTGMGGIKSFIGNPNTGDKVCDFSDVLTDCSWELAGNPFPSAVDWNQVTGKTNLVTDYYYVWNENKAGGAGYEYWENGGHQSSSAVNGYIPSMQGFFVKVDFNGLKTLGLPNSARVHNVLADMWLKDTPVNKIDVRLSNGTNFDDAIVMFESNGQAGKDRQDAEKLFSMNLGIPQVYTIVNNDMKTALNSMPFINDGVTIPVGILAPAAGDYTITVSGIDSFSSLAGLSLEDLKLNYTQNLLTNPVYSFSADATEDAGRFLLHFAGSIGINEADGSAVTIFSNEKTVNINCPAGFKNATVTISNLLGQEIVSQKLNNQVRNQIPVNAVQGYYIVKVQSDSSVKTAKVYIN